MISLLAFTTQFGESGQTCGEIINSLANYCESTEMKSGWVKLQLYGQMSNFREIKNLQMKISVEFT